MDDRHHASRVLGGGASSPGSPRTAGLRGPTSGVPRWSYDFNAKRRTNPFKKPGTEIKGEKTSSAMEAKDEAYPGISHVGEAVDHQVLGSGCSNDNRLEKYPP